MKPSVSPFVVALIVAGCSPKADTSTTQSPRVLAADLGKADDYYRNLYGAPKTERRMADFDFPFPIPGGAGPVRIRLTKPFLVQEYEGHRVKATVVSSEPSRRVIWVKYMLPSPTEQAHINAALKVYGSSWKATPQNALISLTMGGAVVNYESSAGVVAYRPTQNELMVFAPQLYMALRQPLEEAERQKRIAPRF